MGLFGINIDLKEIINERLINTTVLSVVVGISYYIFLNNNVLFAILVGLVTFLLSAIALCLYAQYKQAAQERKKVKYAANRRKSELLYHKQEIETFFMTLDDKLIKIAVAIHDIKPNEGCGRYERYITFDKIGPVLGFIHRYTCRSTACIYNDEAVTQFSQTNIRRIVFDPLFHDLLEVYINTSKKRFPNDFNVMDYTNLYPSRLYN